MDGRVAGVDVDGGNPPGASGTRGNAGGSAEQLPAGAAWHAPAGETATPDPGQLAGQIRDAALGLGFVRVGFTPVARLDAAAGRLAEWLEQDRQGEMAYLAGERADPRALLPAARTLIAVALPYPTAPGTPRPGRLTGYVARYARGDDYHLLIKARLRALADACAEIAGRPLLARPCVDTAPLLEREAAARAGLGFAAKSTMLIVPGVGTNVLLGELLVDLEIAPTSHSEPPHCGSCTACLDACPTQAFVDAHVLDARRCISYLTIELTGPIPRELRPLCGAHVFGCDICQDVCPFNASATPRPAAPELALRPTLEAPDLVELLELGSGAYRRLVRQSALGRVSRARLARNAAVALGNSGDPRAVAPLSRALRSHSSALVRGHAAWALGRLGGADARAALVEAIDGDPDPTVREEARDALSP